MGQCKPLWIIVGGRMRLGKVLAEDLARDHDLVLTSSTSWEGEAWASVHRRWTWKAQDPGVADRMSEDLGCLGRPLAGAVLVAGGFADQPLGSWTPEDLAATWTLDLSFPMLAAQAIAGSLEEGSCMQFLLDTAIHRPWLRRLPYSVAKAGLGALVPGLARALAPKVRVVGHALGTLLPSEGSDPGVLASATLLGRIGDPADLARAVRFAAESPFLTGEILTLDGGQSRV
ncbi:MAG: SDR family oxidoreductase [Acidobacteria bacterium]|nr:SDR family oxidoreductase [Acidobacteriota bacterium]